MSCVFFIPGLQDTTVALDFRVTALEQNGGSDGNSSVAELEVRVETLEGTAADHETRITTAESDVTGIPFLLLQQIYHTVVNICIEMLSDNYGSRNHVTLNFIVKFSKFQF